MKKKNTVIIIAVLLIGLALFFGSKTSRVSDNKQDSSTLLNKQAPNFKLTTLDGQEFRLSQKKGKTIILFGMAGWCGTCIQEGRVLTQVRKVYADKGIEVIGVAFTKGDNEDFLKEFKQLGTINIPLALDTNNVGGKYNLTRLETTYIINKDGVIVYKDEGFTSFDDYKKELDQLL